MPGSPHKQKANPERFAASPAIRFESSAPSTLPVSFARADLERIRVPFAQNDDPDQSGLGFSVDLGYEHRPARKSERAHQAADPVQRAEVPTGPPGLESRPQKSETQG